MKRSTSSGPTLASSAARRFVVMAAGSGGDVAPFAAIAKELARRGKDTVLMAPARYAAFVASSDVKFMSLGADEVFEDVFSGSDVWHPRKGLQASWRYYGAAMRAAHERLRASFNPADTALISSTFAVGARLAEEVDGFPNTTVHLSPAVIFSGDAPPAWPEMTVPLTWPSWLKRAITQAAERFATDPVIGAHVNPALVRAGHLPQRRLFSKWIHSPRRVRYAFPEWFAPAAADWPRNSLFMGFPLGPGQTDPMPSTIDNWLRTSEGPLIVMTAGTAVEQRPPWLRAALAAALSLGVRVMLIEPSRRLDEASTDSRLFSTPFAPFPRVLPLASLLIHHGGIGTFAQALRSGTRQLIVPGAHDQFDNAARAVEHSLASRVSASELSANALSILRSTMQEGLGSKVLLESKIIHSLAVDGAAAIAEEAATEVMPTPAPGER